MVDSRTRRDRFWLCIIALLAPLLIGLELPRPSPFQPSALSTRSGGPLPARASATSQSCGRSGCHPDIVAEWAASPHRFSGLDNPWYRKTYEEMRRQVGPTQARWCGGCHTPGLLAAGLEQPNGSLAAADAGVSCAACHLASDVESTMGQAGLELDLPLVHVLAVSPSPLARRIHDALVRIDPEPHRRAYGRPVLAAAELCSTCHKAYADEPINGRRYHEVMNDYDPWQANSSSGQGMTQSIYFPEPRTCADCHMPPVSSADPAARGGRARSHRFAAANTALPTLHGDREQLRQVTEYLKAGQVTVDIFAMGKGRPPEAGAESRAERVEHLLAPLNRLRAVLRRGETTRFDVVVRTRGVGHLFPAGKNVLKDCWVELRAVDERGRTVFWSGRAGEDTEVEPGAHRVSGLWADPEGEPVQGYGIWNNYAQIYAQRVEPNASSVVHFRVQVPPEVGDRLTLTARVNYRKFRPEFTRWVFSGEATVPRLPIVTMAEASVALPVVAAGAELPDPGAAQAGTEADFERWNDYAYGLAVRGDFLLARKGFQRALAVKPGDADAWTTLGNVEWLLGQRDEARANLERALALRPGLARARFYLALLERDEGRYDRALDHLRAAASEFPREALLWKEIGRLLFMNADYRGAVEAFDKSLAITPQDSATHFMIAQAHRALGNRERSERHRVLFERYKPNPEAGRAVGAYLRKHPEAGAEVFFLHEHGSGPLDLPAPGSGR